jgi:hypothetical protein
MKFSTITTQRLTRAIVMAFATAAFVVPTAVANVTPNNVYGSLDPWAYRAIHDSASSMPLFTEHSAGQTSIAQPISPVSPGLDSWAKNALRGRNASIPLITEHSAGQNSRKAAHSSAAADVPQAGRPNRFDWSDAGIGAGGTLGLILVAGAGMLAIRKRNALAHLQA